MNRFRFRYSFYELALALIVAACPVSAQQPAITNNPADFFAVDLSRYVTTVFSNVPQGNTWSSLPRGQQTFQGVPFKIDGKLEVTGMDLLHIGTFVPSKVTGVPIGRKAERIILLHGTGWIEKDGTPLANVVLHYANGKERSLRIIYGLHVRDWYEDRSDRKKSPSDPNSVVVWNGSEDDMERGTPFRLYKTTFENPLPNEVIQTVDFVSLFSHATPIIVGLTLQEHPTSIPIEPLNSALGHLARKALEQPDVNYIRSMSIRAVASESATPLTNATLWAELTDDQGSYFFGAYRVDGQGTMTFDYPPKETVSLSLLIKAPNRAPVSLNPVREKDGHFPALRTVKLEPGAAIGGLVNDESGKPVEGAEILIASISRAKSKAYTELDFDRVRSDTAGKWQSRSLPQSFSNLVLQIAHAEFRPATFQEPGTNTLSRSNIVTAEQLLAQKAVLSLRRGLLVQGTVKDSTNQPLANAEVYFFDNLNVPKSKRTMKTAADGRFSFVSIVDSGESALAVVAKGFAPKYEAFFVEAATNAFDFQMGAGSLLQGRILDSEQQPITGVLVKLEQWHNTQLLSFRTITDNRGTFSWDAAPEGPLTFSFSKTNVYTMRSSLSAGGGVTTYTMRRMSAASGLVIDAETKKPIDEFTIIRGHSYSPGEPIRWNRYSGNMTKGRNGKYNVRLDDYYNGQSKIMIEAPGYMPVMSPAYTKPGWYTNDFALKKGTGATGTILFANGQPVPNCTVVMADPGNSAYMDRPGDLRTGSSFGDHTRTDAQGHFQFPPKAEVQTLFAVHDQGFVQIQSDQFPADGKIKLEPWGHVKGVVKVGKKVEPGQFALLESFYHRYDEGRARLSLYLRAPLDAEGRFEFDKVPPGDRTAYLQYEFRTSRGGYPSSHGVPIEVKAAETNDITIGGSGRTVIGKVTVLGGDASDVDWKRDLHHMMLRLPDDPDNVPAIMPALDNEAERQKFWNDRNEKIRAFWRTEKGRALERQMRNYVLLFETNGTFHIDNVPPGTYSLSIQPTDPTDENGSYRQLGYLNEQIVVPNGPADQPFDSGSHELRIRRALRIGQNAPALETKTLDGKTVKLSDFKGKHVLLDFCAKWSGSYASQIANLKSLYDTYGKDGRLEIISLSVDYDEKQAREIVSELKVPWTVCYLGQWSQTQVPPAFGVEGIPHAVLITPDGKIAGKNLQGTYMKTAVRKAVETKTVTAQNRL